MIDEKKYNLILNDGLILDHFVLMCNIRDNIPLSKNKRIQGFLNLLHKKGYIEDDLLTEKGNNLLLNHTNIIEKSDHITPYIEKNISTIKESFNYFQWTLNLHKKCEEKLVFLTGKKQVRDKINGKSYSFLPNILDLRNTLSRVIKIYKLNDYDKIEKTILMYINKCFRAKQWFPILGYYIMKNSLSSMVTDMQNLEELEDNEDTSVNI